MTAAVTCRRLDEIPRVAHVAVAANIDPGSTSAAPIQGTIMLLGSPSGEKQADLGTAGAWTLSIGPEEPFQLLIEADELTEEIIRAEQVNLAHYVGNELAACFTEELVVLLRTFEPGTEFHGYYLEVEPGDHYVDIVDQLGGVYL